MFKMPFHWKSNHWKNKDWENKAKSHIDHKNLQLQPLLSSERVYVRFPQYDDYQEWAELRVKSRNSLEPFEPKWPSNAHTLQYYKALLNYYVEGRKNDQIYVLFVFKNSDNTLIGGVSLANIRRGVIQNGQIGYWCGESYSGQGFMRESLKLMLVFAFQHLKLHRVEAASIPTNQRSIRLLESCGFKKEGLLKAYVKINGAWQDHYLYALIENEWQIKT